MTTDDKLLQIISNETKNSIDQMSVVTPSVFSSIFTQFAKQHHTDIDDEQGLASTLLSQECSSLTSMQARTSQDAHELSEHANRAIEAIKAKDETLLNEVLKETQKLRVEIEKLKESVYKDELTNVYNRKWIHDKYLNKDSDTFKDAGTLAIIDLNYFKLVNDTHGHVIGDKVLILIANQLKQSKNEVVRYGGDEFIILFSKDISQDEAKNILNEIRESVIAKKLKAHKHLFRTSFSIGVNSYKEGETLASVIETADKSMYEDKIQIKKRITDIEV